MTDRPIIFSGPMVRALLAGRKTQTRRLATSPLARRAPGDRLYVREATGRNAAPAGVELVYRADHGDCQALHQWNLATGDLVLDVARWLPSIHMPRSASRLTLTVEAIRTEPLQAISEADALAEGIERLRYPERGDWGWPQRRFAELWASLHTRPGERWENNPAVVALTFAVEQRNIDAFDEQAS